MLQKVKDAFYKFLLALIKLGNNTNQESDSAKRIREFTQNDMDESRRRDESYRRRNDF